MLFDLGYPAHQSNHARAGLKGTSLQQFFAAFPTETACLEHVFASRYDRRELCAACGPTARWSPVPGRRMMRHRRCNGTLFPYSGTLLEHSRIGAQRWFYLMLHMANSHESVNGGFVQRHLGLSLRAAHRMQRAIRLHLAALDQEQRIGAPGERIHVRIELLRGAWDPERASLNRANVMFIGAGDAIHFVVVDLSRCHHLLHLLRERIASDAILVTDCYRTMRRVNNYGKYPPTAITFDPAYRGGDGGRLDTITSFLTYFRRGWRTQHQNVYRRHLWLYLAEYRFRYNRRRRSQDTFADMVSRFPDLEPATRDELRCYYSEVS